MIVGFGSWQRFDRLFANAPRFFLILAMALLAIVTASTESRAGSTSVTGTSVGNSPTKCVSPIVSCGCTITKKGFYEIGADLSSAQGLTPTNGCIDIRGSQVTLSGGIEGGGAFDIVGPGGSTPNGIGVHVFKSSNNDLLELPGDLDGWDIGIEIDGNRNIAQDFTIEDSGTAGVLLAKGSDNTLASFTATFNLNLGVWIAGGGKNQVRGALVNSNDNIGVLIGCSRLGITGRSCSPQSSWNKITDISANNNTVYGIAIDKGNSRNTVAGVGSQGNGSDDLFDANPDCKTDLWFFNFFTNASQPCIH